MKNKCVIAICDDETAILKVISSSVQAAFAELFDSQEIHSFTSTEKLDAYLSENAADLLFLDIAMPKCDGIEYACKLREKNPNLPIVFVTSAEERVWETFKVKPFGFIRKNHFLPDLLETAKRFYEEYQKNRKNSNLYIVQKAKTYSLDISQIKFIESCQRNQIIHFCDKKEPITITGYTLYSLAEELVLHGFYRVHKGYVVNMNQVKLIATDGVYLKDNTFIPINKRNIGEFKSAFLEYTWENSVKLHV